MSKGSVVSVSIALLFVFIAVDASRDLQKRGFSTLGCMGDYDIAAFARLNRVCEECFQLYRESDMHTLCRSNCFKNVVFKQCVEALLLKKEQPRLDEMVERIYGKRSNDASFA